MQITSGKLPWSRIGLIVVGSAALLMATSHFVKSKNNTGEIFIPRHHETSHVHDHVDQSWPPRPRNMTNIIDFSKAGEEESRHLKIKQKFDNLEQAHTSHGDFKDALGRKFTRIGLSEDVDKSRGTRSDRYIYFSRANNKTVEVVTDSTGLKSVKSVPASEYQPEITGEETAEATELARDFFIKQGFSRVAGLKGFGIMAYSPNGKGFYPNRVIYISFHSAVDAPPEFMAWVDLTNGAVIKAREEKK